MRPSISHVALFSCLLLALACTSNQELGDRGDAGVEGDGDGDGDGDVEGNGDLTGDGDGEVDGPIDQDPELPEEEDVEHGRYKKFVIASSGLTTLEGSSVRIGVTSAAGNLGCGLTSGVGATPGREAVAVAMHINPEGDGRCPAGVYPVEYDPEDCSFHNEFGVLPDNCASYKYWDEKGELAAYLLARGGVVSITEQRESENVTHCKVEVSLTFEGGNTVEDTFGYTFDPFGPSDAFCAH
jgi:hypothetical protein